MAATGYRLLDEPIFSAAQSQLRRIMRFFIDAVCCRKGRLAK